MLTELDEYVGGLVRKHASRGVLIDANLLIVLLIGRQDRSAVSRFPHSKEYTAAEFDVLDRFVRRFRRIITTPHILTEVSNLSGKLRGDDLTLFRAMLAQEICQYEERQRAAQEVVQSPYFAKLGLTDAGIERIARDGLLVLTDDLALAGALEKVRIDVLNFNRIRPLAWS
ncbi:MAG: hypothetical protein ABSH05_27055 [Bryobacteraceae bacterium]